MNILQNIFKDHYEEMFYILHPRDSVIENVEKMIHCGDPSFGGAMFACPCCGTFKYVPFRCHSVSVLPVATCTPLTGLLPCLLKSLMSNIDTVFLPSPANSDIFFLEDRSLLNCLFSAVNSVVSPYVP